jgi:hypothetical protein
MAAGSTYTPIATTTTSGTSTNTVSFSSISGSYTDIVIAISAGLTGAANRTAFAMRVGNGSVDTGTNYSSTYVAGNGSAASSGRNTSDSKMFLGIISEAIGTTLVHLQNYANTTTYKTALSRGNSLGQSASQDVGAFVNLWRSTSVINTIQIYPADGTAFQNGCTITLYGIAAA